MSTSGINHNNNPALSSDIPPPPPAASLRASLKNLSKSDSLDHWSHEGETLDGTNVKISSQPDLAVQGLKKSISERSEDISPTKVARGLTPGRAFALPIDVTDHGVEGVNIQTPTPRSAKMEKAAMKEIETIAAHDMEEIFSPDQTTREIVGNFIKTAADFRKATDQALEDFDKASAAYQKVEEMAVSIEKIDQLQEKGKELSKSSKNLEKLYSQSKQFKNITPSISKNLLLRKEWIRNPSDHNSPIAVAAAQYGALRAEAELEKIGNSDSTEAVYAKKFAKLAYEEANEATLYQAQGDVKNTRDAAKQSIEYAINVIDLVKNIRQQSSES